MTTTRFQTLSAFPKARPLGPSFAGALSANIDARRQLCSGRGADEPKNRFETLGGNRLSRAQRRQIKKLAARVDKITSADRKFFERFPHRQHRLRLAGRAEIEYEAVMADESNELPPGCRRYAVVKNIADGSRLRAIVIGDEGWDVDCSEHEALERFESARTPQISQIEQQMVELARSLGLRNA